MFLLAKSCPSRSKLKTFTTIRGKLKTNHIFYNCKVLNIELLETLNFMQKISNTNTYCYFVFIVYYSGDVLFENLYQNHFSKISAMTFSTVSALFTTPLILSLISHQENNQYRILIGQLITSNLSTLLHWNASVQVQTTFQC